MEAIGEEEKRFCKWDEISSSITENNNKISQCNYAIKSIRKSIDDVEKEIKELAVSYTHLRAHEQAEISYAVFCLKKKKCYTDLRAHETVLDLGCRLRLENKERLAL
ncbi:hypothetical protein CDFC105_13890 [Clostridioides difficile]|nr:hypothetical protein CDFC105_13890 [Clostridioides difficile]